MDFSLSWTIRNKNQLLSYITVINPCNVYLDIIFTLDTQFLIKMWASTHIQYYDGMDTLTYHLAYKI